MIIWPPALVTELAERRVVIFIGSGVSKSADVRFPSWPELLEVMKGHISTKRNKDLVGKLVKAGRLLDAAELVNSLLPPADRRAILESKFKIVPVPVSDIYDDILSLDPKVCITTNYDQLIEKNFERLSGYPSHEVRTYGYDNFLSDLRSPARVVLKIHGCITETGNIVLDKKSYFNAKAEYPGIYDAVKALSTVNTILFLGYSMGDPDIQLILEDINSKSKTDHRHYAFVPKFEHPSLRDANMHTYNIQFIEYPSSRHDMFPAALKELRSSVEATRASTGSRA